jgi:hypothetical protein
MKKSLILILLAPSTVFSQTENLIRNPGFEYKTSEAEAYEPNKLSQFKFVDYWEEHIYLVPQSELQYAPGQDNHSPDFFSSSTSFRAFDAISGAIVNPHGGNNYVGMGQVELIQQEFSEVAELIGGKKYTISFYIQPLKNGQSGGNWSSYTLLSIMLRKNKMKYENHTNNRNEWCTDLANDHRNEDGTTYHVADIPINLSSYPLGVWTKISVDFDAPSNAEDYDYVIFETNDNLDMCDSYLCLDDFRFYQTGCAEDNCSQTSGILHASTSSNNHNIYAPWWIDNIENISHLKIEIFALNASLVRTIDVYATNGIKSRYYWDGKNDNGYELANAQYIFKITLENECMKNTANIHVYVDNQYYVPAAIPFQIPAFNVDNSGYKIPKECCVTDIYIDNVTLGGPDQKRFVASHSVNVATLPSSWVTLTSNADVLFRAGSFVEVGPGFDPDNGTYNVEVMPCPGRYSNPEEEDNIIPSFNYTNLENTEKENIEEIKVAEKAIAIYPNPTKDKLFFDIGIAETYNAIIEDGVGNIVLKEKINSNIKAIDCTSLANGIYFVVLSNENRRLYFKFVKN